MVRNPRAASELMVPKIQRGKQAMEAVSSILLVVSSVILAGAPLLLPIKAHAGSTGTLASGDPNAVDVNQGSGSQINADDWEAIETALAGEGAQASGTLGSSNTGSGIQDNSSVISPEWREVENANSGSGNQFVNSKNSDGGDRISDDVVLVLGENAQVAHNDLESAVSGNEVLISGDFSATDSSLSIGAGGGFTGLSGIQVIALESGNNTTQNVGVNVTAGVDAGISNARIR